MFQRFFHRHPRALAISGVALLLFLVTRGLVVLEAFPVAASYDATFGLAPTPSLPAAPVVVVYLDIDSYVREGTRASEPWSRSSYAQLIDRLTRAGARAVVFDVIFDKPSENPAMDQELARAITRNGRVILASEIDFSSRSTGEGSALRQTRQLLPLPLLQTQAAGVGIAKFAITPDNMVRRFFPGRLSQDQPGLTWATAQFLNLASLTNAALKSGHGWVRYYGPPLTLPHVSLKDALDPQSVGDDFFRNKIIFIGARPLAAGFGASREEFRNPYSSWSGVDPFMPAVEVHATQMLNLVRQDWLQRLSPRAEGSLLVLLAVVLPLILLHFRPLPATGLAVLIEIGIVVVVIWLHQSQRLWFPWLLVSAVQVPGALGASILYHSAEWYRARRQLEALRRQAELKIKEQAALIDKAQDAILVQDLEGRFIYANPSAERLYGWSAQQFQETSATAQLFAPCAGKIAEVRALVLESGEWAGELAQATKTGQQLRIESRWTLIRDDQGQPKSLLLINTDVTEKRALEAQVLRTQRLDTIGSLAGGMAHDLNNALAPILMGIHLIGRKNCDEETQRMLQVMEINTRRGADMVRQVLTFSRGHQGENERLKPGALVREMESIVRQTLPRAISISSMVPVDLWEITANPTQLHQVLLNLCVNARDAMPQGGELTLAADNVDLTAEEAAQIPNAASGQYVLLLVSDTGTGIPPEVLPRIFDPFFTTKAPDKGTGLGLSTIVRIARSHGGFLTVKSELGQGTTFEVYFPRAQPLPGQETRSPETVEAATPGGEWILFVDDERAMCEIASTIFEGHGYRVITAHNGAEGLVNYRENAAKIALVISDLSMPVLSGQEMILTLLEERPDLAVILMSGESDAIKTDPKLGSLACLPKPFQLQQLLSAVAKALAGRCGS